VHEAATHLLASDPDWDLRSYLECGILCFGFGRALCTGCGQGFVIAFSCKGRGVCPSCNGRHMAQTAAHLVDHVIPPVPVRQRVISVPKRLRGMLADRPAAVAALTKIFLTEIEQHLLATSATPRRGSPFVARGVSLDGRVSLAHRDRRRAIFRNLDTTFRDMALRQPARERLRRLLSASARRHHYPRGIRPFPGGTSLRRPVPRLAFGQSRFLAIRLVEASVRHVSVGFNGSSTRSDNFAKLRDPLLPQLDAGLAELILGLKQNGLLASTAVLVTGEFGRSRSGGERASRPRSLSAGGDDAHGGQRHLGRPGDRGG